MPSGLPAGSRGSSAQGQQVGARAGVSTGAVDSAVRGHLVRRCSVREVRGARDADCRRGSCVGKRSDVEPS